MFVLGWGVGGESWKWRMRLLAWEEELVVECVAQVSSCFLQDGLADRWVWKLHSSKCYTVKSTYVNLTTVDITLNERFEPFLWLKSVPLKVNIFVWRLFMNRLPTKDNLHKRAAIAATHLSCAAKCGWYKDRDHLFFRCDVYGQVWLMVSKWLGFESVFHGNIWFHSSQFRGLGGISKNSRTAFTIIWISFIYVIWKDRNNKIFHNKADQIEMLAEKVKLQTFWWLKSYYILFEFDYSFWRLNPLCCLKVVVQFVGFFIASL
jgi:hypothetical protein